MNTATPARNTRRRPTRSPSRPPGRSKPPNTSVYAFITRAGADAGALDDVVQRRVDALLEEDLAGGGHDPLVALPRVRADLGFTPAGLSW
ncbi:MAG: hypothetical protein JWR58_5520, partial [Pseudonocardia sp.]|nr:hypothetical protein [Pseudonocardia sp.]